MSFLVFAGQNYEAKGGWDDFREEFPTMAEALNWVVENKEGWDVEWYHIVNLSTKCIEDRGQVHFAYPNFTLITEDDEVTA